ncbi:MAG: lipopolysaccharide transport system ATP-binding [Geobacteraceae bacterium]|nr:MAG: lipopolysaccharide transport system ATP-binding [Geobacteraceae bacterium]
MSDAIAIKVENLSKIYKLYNSPVDRLKESLHPLRRQYHHDFYALNDVSFEIKKGESLGIIGKNGSGKSTLLKILTGVLTPTCGSVTVNGKVSALLELGAGFNPELTGIENVYFNGMLMGYTREEMDERLDDILSFADIGEYACQPVKTYSSGMFVRLAFAVAVLVEPDILIVDEALSVGDIYFQAKCIKKMRTILDNGATLCYVSHDMRSIKSVCSVGIYIVKGVIEQIGDAAQITESYDRDNDINKSVIDSNNIATTKCTDINNYTINNSSSYNRIQNGKASFIGITILNSNKQTVNTIRYGEIVTLRYIIEAYEDIDILSCGYKICDKNGIEIIYSGLMIEDKPIMDVRKGDKILVDWEFAVSLMHGEYSISSVLAIPIDLDNALVDICDNIPIAYQFKVDERPKVRLYGLVHWDNRVNIVKLNK